MSHFDIDFPNIYIYIYIMANTLVFRAKHELPKATSKQKGS